MPKYYKICKKQGHSEIDCWVIHPELHKKVYEVVEDQSRGMELVGTAINTTEVLSNGRVLGKPIANLYK